jgi:hypothetical protein
MLPYERLMAAGSSAGLGDEGVRAMRTTGADWPNASGLARGVPIHVVATTLDGTRDALVAATALARATDSRVCVIARTGIPTGLSRVPATHAAQAVAGDIGNLPEASSPVVDIVAILSRQPTDLVPFLPPHALVFIGGHSGRWWPSVEQRTAHAFARLGCRVVFIHTERVAPPD